MSDKDISEWIKPQSEFGHLFSGENPSPEIKGPFVVDAGNMDIEDAAKVTGALVEMQDNKAKAQDAFQAEVRKLAARSSLQQRRRRRMTQGEHITR